MEKSEIIKRLKKEGMNFISNNYYKLSKEELKEICIAYIYQCKEAEKHSVINYSNLAIDDINMYL